MTEQQLRDRFWEFMGNPELPRTEPALIETIFQYFIAKYRTQELQSLLEEVRKFKKEVVIDGSTSSKFANGLMDEGYNKCLSEVEHLITNLLEK